jgi:hypothetical protein
MPLQNTLSENTYVKVRRLFTSSRERTENSKGTNNYQIRLSEDISYVVGFEVTGYSLPVDIAPTFLRSGNDFQGNDAVDFIFKAGFLEKTFSFFWPNFKYESENLERPALSYTNALKSILEEILHLDPDFGGMNVQIQVLALYDETTRIDVVDDGVNFVLGGGISFLFASGPNSTRSAYKQMGFDKIDTPIAMSTTTSPINLTPFSYCDVTVQEIPELVPLKRIYFDRQNSLVVRNDPNMTRTRLLSSQPNRVLKTLTVRLSLEGGISAPSDKEHDINYTVFSMQPENGAIPAWLKQAFVM